MTENTQDPNTWGSQSRRSIDKGTHEKRRQQDDHPYSDGVEHSDDDEEDSMWNKVGQHDE